MGGLQGEEKGLDQRGCGMPKMGRRRGWTEDVVDWQRRRDEEVK